MERKIYPTTYDYVNGYKSCSTSGHDSGIVIFIKKRFLGFLWWVYVKNRFGEPITYNHSYNAKAFMEGKIGYYDHIKYEHTKYGVDPIVSRKTREDAWEEISKSVEITHGTKPDIECVKKSWEFDGENYVHVAKEYASLWHSIYEQNGTKLWNTIKKQR